MERHDAPAALVADLDLEPEDVAELPLERLDVGIDGLGSVARTCAADVASRSRTSLLPAGLIFRLAHRKPLSDNFMRQSLGVRSRSDSPRVPHADIASQQRLPHEFRQVQQTEQV